MLAVISDPDNLEVLAGRVSRFLSWHRNRGSGGFSLQLKVLWIGPEPAPANLPPVSESAGVYGRWMIYRFRDDDPGLRDLRQVLTGTMQEPFSASPSIERVAGRFIPVMPHDQTPTDLLEALKDPGKERFSHGWEYLLQHRETGRLLSSTDLAYLVRPLL